jgi:hypothetical protein
MRTAVYNPLSFRKKIGMKSFFSWFLTILLIAAVAAALTVPGDEKFVQFIGKDKGGDTMSCKPVIEKTTPVKVIVKIFSLHRVSYCEVNKSPAGTVPVRIAGTGSGDSTAAKITRLKLAVPKITLSETYLGLFGRFWKL